MFNSFASSKPAAECIAAGSGWNDATCKRRALTRLLLIAAILPLVVSTAAMAQVSAMAAPTPTMGATSPLGITSGSSVSPTGIPLGSTELASPGISPAPTYSTGSMATPSNGASCST